MRQWKQYLATCARGFALMTSGCAARTGPIRGDASVEGDTTSAVGRGQVTTDSQSQRDNRRPFVRQGRDAGVPDAAFEPPRLEARCARKLDGGTRDELQFASILLNRTGAQLQVEGLLWKM